MAEDLACPDLESFAFPRFQLSWRTCFMLIKSMDLASTATVLGGVLS